MINRRLTVTVIVLCHSPIKICKASSTKQATAILKTASTEYEPRESSCPAESNS